MNQAPCSTLCYLTISVVRETSVSPRLSLLLHNKCIIHCALPLIWVPCILIVGKEGECETQVRGTPVIIESLCVIAHVCMDTLHQYMTQLAHTSACALCHYATMYHLCVCPVYVTTASNPTESSYACYLDGRLDTYLGDCYSVNWMENVDKVCSGTVTSIFICTIVAVEPIPP